MVSIATRIISEKNTSSHNFFRSLVFFLMLMILPLTTLWLVLSIVQENIANDNRQHCLREMSEITAHMGRLSNHETYFQESLRRLSDSFRWVADISEISNPFNEKIIELFLYDNNGERLPWPNERITKRKISEDYLKILLKLRKNPGISLSRKEQATATAFSGNHATAYGLVQTIETLVNFQGLGLKKYGILLEPKLPGTYQSGYIIAWLYPDNLKRHILAKRAVQRISKLAGEKFTFAWIDLHDPRQNGTSSNLKISRKGLTLLTNESLKSGFELPDELVSINDTRDGIRLICSRSIPQPPPLLDYYYNFLRTFLPALVMFLIWKTVFMVRFDISAKFQFAIVFGFSALTGISVLLAGTIAWQYEKQNSLEAEYKQNAVQILEKIDRNFSASFGDLLRQYRHLNSLLRKSDKPIEKILQPLAIAQAEDNIAFASYTDQKGSFAFKAPGAENLKNHSTTIESKYSRLIGGVSAQLINTFNAGRINQARLTGDIMGVSAISSRPIESLLANRSTMQNISFDGDATLTFMDLTIDQNDTASGCLFIVHEPRKMEQKYLALSSGNITNSTGFTLAAFPKKHADKNSFFPRYSLAKELPLWKLQDLLNQTQVASFKRGRVDQKEVLVAGIPGHNLNNYNLFLIIPWEPIQKQARWLSGIFISATALTLIFISCLSFMLIKSLISPISKLAANAATLQSTTRVDHKIEAKAYEGNELESISTGLTDLILKVREFNEGQSVRKHLLPSTGLRSDQLVLDGFQLLKGIEEQEVYHFARISETHHLIFLMRSNLSGIEASLTLSMARMAIRLISEELNILSPIRCLKDLEEYFRINLRRKLGGDLFLMIINHEEKKAVFSGCGNINLVYINAESGEDMLFKMPDCEPGDKKFFDFGNQEVDFSRNCICIALSPVLGNDCAERLQLLLPALIQLAQTRKALSKTLRYEVEKSLVADEINTASLVFAHNLHNEEEKQS